MSTMTFQEWQELAKLVEKAESVYTDIIMTGDTREDTIRGEKRVTPIVNDIAVFKARLNKFIRTRG